MEQFSIIEKKKKYSVDMKLHEWKDYTTRCLHQLWLQQSLSRAAWEESARKWIIDKGIAFCRNLGKSFWINMIRNFEGKKIWKNMKYKEYSLVENIICPILVYRNLKQIIIIPIKSFLRLIPKFKQNILFQGRR